MATIKDVAKEAGVSIATVSRVINGSSKAGKSSIMAVNKAMTQLGYRPNAAARALVCQNSNTVGLLVGDVSDPFFGSLTKMVDGVVHQANKQLLIGNGYHRSEDERRVLELFMRNRCDAIVVHSKGLSDQELCEFAREIPNFVLINRFVPELANRCVFLDNFKGAYLATSYLIQQGHRHIGCLASCDKIEDAVQRVEGYIAALKDNGIALSRDYIEYNEPNSAGGEKAMMNLLSKSLKMTAMVTYNDYMAAGALSVLDENSILVPNALSIVGFDDGLIARYVHPRLTTVHYPIELMAEVATKLALNPAISSEITLCFTPTLVKRNSVMACSVSPYHQC